MIEETPEMLAAIDEGLRSAREEGTISLEELREEMKTWPKMWAVEKIIELLQKLSPADFELIKRHLASGEGAVIPGDEILLQQARPRQ